jgi:chemotaxis protein MotB
MLPVRTFSRLVSACVGLSAALSVTACGVPEEKYNKDLGDLKAMMAADKAAADKAAAEAAAAAEAKLAAERQTAAAAAAAAAADAAAREAAAKKALDECTAAGGDKGRTLATCQRDRDEARARLERVTASIEKVRGALKAMSDAGKLSVKVDRGFLVVSMAGDILFDTGKSSLKKEAEPVLRELAAVLKLLPDRMFQVAGHTDNQGEEARNWSLSMDRALVVTKFLINEGVQGQSVSAGGYAFYRAVGDNTTDAGRQQNRRVEFLLIPNLSEIINLGK